MRIIVLVLAILFMAAACRTSDQTGDGEVVATTGTVQYVDLEGGFYGIVAEDGTRYDPVDLNEEFREDGLRVRFRAERQEDVVSIRMWGEAIRILAIERL